MENFEGTGMALHQIMTLRRLYVQGHTGGREAYPGQYPFLTYVAEHEGCTQTEVADGLLVSPASIALSAKRLQKSGLLRKRMDESNLRCRRLTVTEEGKEIVKRFHEAHMSFDRRMMQGFTQKELEQLMDYLSRMIRNAAEAVKNKNDRKEGEE